MLESNSSETAVTSDLVDSPSVRPCKGVSRGSDETKQMKGKQLTEKQRRTLEIIRRHLKVRKIPPSRSEIQQELGVRHQASVDHLLAALARKQWLRLHAGVDRGIELLREGAPILDPDQLPEVAAGDPIVGEEHTPPRLHDFESFAGEFEARPDLFLRVKGDSLDKVGFETGDTVAVKRTPEATEGDLVVARIGQEITLKRYSRKSESVIELQPESTNPEHQPIEIDPNTHDFEIVGIVVGAIVGTRRRDEPGLGAGTG